MPEGLGLDPEATGKYMSTLLQGAGKPNQLLGEYGETRAREAATLLSPAQLTEFIQRLDGPEGCDFKVDGTWSCPGGQDLSQARAVLAAMGFEPDVTETLLGCFTALGGYCSCEVLFNAVERIEAAIKGHGHEE